MNGHRIHAKKIEKNTTALMKLYNFYKILRRSAEK